MMSLESYNIGSKNNRPCSRRLSRLIADRPVFSCGVGNCLKPGPGAFHVPLTPRTILFPSRAGSSVGRASTYKLRSLDASRVRQWLNVAGSSPAPSFPLAVSNGCRPGALGLTSPDDQLGSSRPVVQAGQPSNAADDLWRQVGIRESRTCAGNRLTSACRNGMTVPGVESGRRLRFIPRSGGEKRCSCSLPLQCFDSAVLGHSESVLAGRQSNTLMPFGASRRFSSTSSGGETPCLTQNTTYTGFVSRESDAARYQAVGSGRLRTTSRRFYSHTTPAGIGASDD